MIISNKLIQLLIIIVALITSCTSQSKKDAADFFLKANQALNQKNYAEALRLYDEAIAKNADFSDAYLNKGITLLKLGQPEQAYDVLTEAIKVDPTLIQANLVRAESALDLGRLRDARQDLQIIEKEYKDSTRFFLVRGNLLSAEGNAALAMADYDKSIQLDKLNVEAYVNRGTIYYGLKNMKSAREDFENALAVSPNQPEALNNLGLIATTDHNWSEALSYFDKVLSSRPSDPYALNNKGYVLLQTGKGAEAKPLIERSLEKLPVNGYAYRNLGIYYQQSGQIDQAIISFQKAIDIAEPVEDLYGLTGLAYLQQNNKAEACKIWKLGIILKDPLAISEAAKHCQ